jgi:hypothetical protein
VRRGDFLFVQGNPKLYSSSAQVKRTFCPNCGTQLTFEHSDFANEIDVTTCSLDDPERVPPKDHIHVRTRLSWVAMADRLPEFAEARVGRA